MKFTCTYVTCALAITITSVSSFALDPNELSAPSSVALSASRLTLRQDAVAVSDQTIRLTPAMSAKRGVAETPPICAKEYKLQYDLNAGSGNGAGFTMRQIRENTYPSQPNMYAAYDPSRLTSDGRPNQAAYLHFDTYRDYDGLTRTWQRDDNSIYYDTLRVNADNSFYPLNLINQSMPFRMKGGGWFTVSMHVKLNNQMTLRILKDGILYLDTTVEHYSLAGEKHYWALSAWTGIAASEQSIRNVAFEGIVADDCDPAFSDEELTQELEEACGVVSQSCNKECYSSTMQPLLDANKITAQQFETFLSTCQELICEEKTDSAYNVGYNAGVGSIDIDTITKEATATGFKAGVESIDQEALRKAAFEEGYKAGFADGAGSIDQSAIKALAYQEGFDAGKSSVVCPTDGADNGEKVAICHKAGDKKFTTLSVSKSAVAAHLSHGDTLGACPVNSKQK